MFGRLRIWHTADSHIGADLPVRPRCGRPRRGDDLVASFRRVMRRAIEQGCDLVIHAGDVFDCPRPSGRALAAAAEPMIQVASGGIPIVIVPGNHERSAIPSTVLLAHPNIHIVAEPRTLRFRLAGVHVHRHQVLFRRDGEGPAIVYCGSPDRVSFAEMDEPKGAVLVERKGRGLAHRYDRRECLGPCTGRVDRAAYLQRISLRDRVLGGVDDGPLHEFEKRLEPPHESDEDEGDHEIVTRRAKTIRMAFDYLAVVREARNLMHGLLLLPGAEGCVKTAVPTGRGVAFDRLVNTAADARRVLLRHATLTRSTDNRGSAYVPKTVVDALCVAVRQLRGHPDVYRSLSREQVAKLDPRNLLAAVFGLDAGTWSNNEKNWTGFSARS